MAVGKLQVDEGGPTELERGRVYISGKGDRPAQYFDGIDPEVWEFRVGGYRVCEKWLKDRRKRELDLGEIGMYRRIVAIFGSTVEVMAQLEEMAPSWPLGPTIETGDQPSGRQAGLENQL